MWFLVTPVGRPLLRNVRSKLARDASRTAFAVVVTPVLLVTAVPLWLFLRATKTARPAEVRIAVATTARHYRALDWFLDYLDRAARFAAEDCRLRKLFIIPGPEPGDLESFIKTEGSMRLGVRVRLRDIHIDIFPRASLPKILPIPKFLGLYRFFGPKTWDDQRLFDETGLALELASHRLQGIGNPVARVLAHGLRWPFLVLSVAWGARIARRAQEYRHEAS